MARPRAFDNDVALDAAVACFWRRGLGATSVRELADEMGLNAPSLYNAFGDKRGLFVLALERYAATTMRARLALLAEVRSPTVAVRTFFRTTIDRSLADAERRGCFIINSALDVAPHDAEIGQAVAGYLGEIEAFLRGRLTAARQMGEIPDSVDPRDMGRLLLGLLVAIRVLARTGATRAELESMTRPALAPLGDGQIQKRDPAEAKRTPAAAPKRQDTTLPSTARQTRSTKENKA